MGKSKYLKVTFFIVLVLLIFTTITMGIFSFLNKNKTGIVETKTFSEIPGFSFEYPVPKDGIKEVRKINENEYSIFFDTPEGINFEVAPQIKIVKNYDGSAGFNKRLLKINQNKIYYDSNKDSGKIAFFINPRIEVYLFTHEGEGYSKKITEKMIIKTFQLDPSFVSSISGKEEYGEKVKYELNKAIEFPDFTLKYTGTAKTPGPNGAKWSITDYNFEVTGKGETKVVSWSSGMGVIGPNVFEVNGKKYMLEMSKAKKLEGWLRDDEIVITPDSEYRK